MWANAVEWKVKNTKGEQWFLVDIKESQELDVRLVELIVDGNQDDNIEFKVDDQSGTVEAGWDEVWNEPVRS